MSKVGSEPSFWASNKTQQSLIRLKTALSNSAQAIEAIEVIPSWAPHTLLATEDLVHDLIRWWKDQSHVADDHRQLEALAVQRK